MKLRLLEKGNKKDIQVFMSFPFGLYRESKLWVPPFPGEIETVMTPAKHPFYAHSDADFFVVESDKEVLGRISVLKNQNYCEFHNEKTAFFFYFEAINDQQVSSMLLTKAEEWAQEHGANKLMGPRGFLRSSCIGLLVDGFEFPPAMGIA